jgi:thymidine kinase
MEQQPAFLKIYYGPMFAKKTTSVFGDLEIYSRLSKSILYVNHVYDTRDSGSFSSHSFIKPPDKITFIKTDSISCIKNTIFLYDVIAIDECQFFDDLLYVKQLVDTLKGKVFIVSGLLTDSNGNLFGNLHKLLPYADESIQLYSVCDDCSKQGIYRKALFSFRLCKDLYRICVGNEYIPLCRDCFLKRRNQSI